MYQIKPPYPVTWYYRIEFKYYKKAIRVTNRLTKKGNNKLS